MWSRSPTLARGRTFEARMSGRSLASLPEQASRTQAQRGLFLPWPSWHLCTSAGRVPSSFWEPPMPVVQDLLEGQGYVR